MQSLTPPYIWALGPDSVLYRNRWAPYASLPPRAHAGPVLEAVPSTSVPKGTPAPCPLLCTDRDLLPPPQTHQLSPFRSRAGMGLFHQEQTQTAPCSVFPLHLFSHRRSATCLAPASAPWGSVSWICHWRYPLVDPSHTTQVENGSDFYFYFLFFFFPLPKCIFIIFRIWKVPQISKQTIISFLDLSCNQGSKFLPSLWHVPTNGICLTQWEMKNYFFQKPFPTHECHWQCYSPYLPLKVRIYPLS